MTGDDTPLVPGPVYGLRTWSIKGAKGSEHLAAPIRGTAWPPGSAMKATCPTRRHAAPKARCGCGLYALHPTADSARSMLSQASGGDVVAGIAAAWGPVEVHADGFRARRARPHTLIVPRGAKRKVADRIRRLALDYGAEILEAGPDELLAHCRGRGLGLDQAAVAALVAGAVAAEHRRARRQRRLERVGYGVATVAALTLLVGAIHAWPGVQAWLSGPPARIPPESRRLVLVEQHMLDDGEGGSIYLAVVRNQHPTKTALGVFVAGTLRDRDGAVLAHLDSRLDTEVRPALAPGDTGVVVNFLDDLGDLEGRVARFRTRPLARAFRRGAPRPPLRLRAVRLDRRRCLITAAVNSDRRRISASVLILAYDGRGHLAWGNPVDIGPLPRGPSHQVLDRIEPHRCAAPPARVSAHANLAVGQVLRR